ncbi:MAG: glutaredoxin family protein [Bacillus sp. (in: firmicutes)]
MLKLYSKQKCHLCDKAKEELEIIGGLQFEVIDIEKNDELLEKYGLMIPVLEYDNQIVQYGQINKNDISNFLKNTTIK